MASKQTSAVFTAASLLCSSLLLSSISAAKPFDPLADVHYFDAGPSGSAIIDQGTPLHLNTQYSADAGFGWLQAPREAFIRNGLSKSRDALTIDGVSARRLKFRADVPPGVWHVTAWTEAGLADAPTLRLLVQGKQRQLSWQTFAPQAERRRSPQKIYRVFHRTAVVEAAGLSLQFDQNAEDVQLLGIALVRSPEAASSGQRRVLRRIMAAGRMRSEDSLSTLAEVVQNRLAESHGDPFYALWAQRLGWLGDAERLFRMRGWGWANHETGLGMFERMYQSVMLLDGLLGPDPRLTDPLAQRAVYIRGRILYWLNRQRGGDHELADARRDLEMLRAVHSDDEILAMYLGKKIEAPDPCDRLESASNAPQWSIAQREALCRMRQIAHWWADQQAENGEFGGKFGDDVELLRWWAPLVLAGDDKALAAWRRLADGVWNSDHVHDGYARQLRDVEHAAEFISDTAPLMAIYSDDPIYQDRLAPTARHFEALWTGMSNGGRRHFRSAWFSSTAVDNAPPKNRDVEYNARAVAPIRYLAWRRADPDLADLLRQWSLAWVHAALSTNKGKPAGILPASIRYPDEAFNGDEPQWHRANMHWRYFDWQHHAGSLMLDQLLLTYTLTGDKALLRPIELTLELIRCEEAAINRGDAARNQAGSRTWAAATLVECKLFWNVVEQWRLLTGDDRWDNLILRRGTPYVRYRLSGDDRHLVEGLDELLDVVRYNTPLLTSEALHTDRVYVPRSELLKAMLTGDGVTDNLSPYYAVTWEQTDEDFTALVTAADADCLEVELFSHAATDRQIVARLWQLKPGRYEFVMPKQVPRPRSIEIHQRGQRAPITLPGRELTTVHISRMRDL